MLIVGYSIEIIPTLQAVCINLDREEDPVPEIWTFPFKAAALTAAPLAHLDVEAAQHSVDTEQVSDRVVYVTVQDCVGD